MALSFVAVTKAKPREKPYKLADGHGLYPLVTPQGGRYWRMHYRFEGKAKTVAMGVFPLITLAEALEKREAARKLLAEGLYPSAMRKKVEAQEAFDATTGFRTVAEEWLAKREREGLGDVTIGKVKWLLEFAYPSLGNRKIGEITSMELLAVLREVEGRGRHQTARRLRSVCGRVFRYTIATGRAEHDLSANLRDALTTPKVKHLAAITPLITCRDRRCAIALIARVTATILCRMLPDIGFSHAYVRQVQPLT